MNQNKNDYINYCMNEKMNEKYKINIGFLHKRILYDVIYSTLLSEELFCNGILVNHRKFNTTLILKVLKINKE